MKKPLQATRHCRHYSYIPGEGACCAAGVDLSIGAVLKCLPEVYHAERPHCPKREEFTPGERRRWKAYVAEHVNQTAKVLALVGDEDRGSFSCPICQKGTVRYVRARSNGHLHLACSTPQCIHLIQ